MGTAPPPNRADRDAQRRSQRVMLKVSVVVLAHGADNKRVSEETRTVTVNAHGAMILLGMKVSERIARNRSSASKGQSHLQRRVASWRRRSLK